MVRKYAILSLFVIITSTQTLKAQYAWDFGVNAGIANYLGEIGGGAGEARDWILDLKLEQSRWNPGVFVRYRLDYDFAITTSFNYLRLQGADSLSLNPNRFTRNLSFKNDVLELAVVGEYYFFNQPDVGRTGRYLLDFKAYLYGGAGVFYNNPKANLDGQTYALQPLNTENLEKPYSRFQVAVPMGFGFYYTFSRIHRFGFNLGYRLTFTDYIDDASSFYPDPDLLESDIARSLSNRTAEVQENPLAQTLDDGGAPIYLFFKKGGIRGNPKTNDSYVSANLTYSYVLRGKPSSFGKRKNYLYGRKRGKSGRARF
jgi:hypothetical protein